MEENELLRRANHREKEIIREEVRKEIREEVRKEIMKDSGCRTFEQYLERTKAYLELKRGLNFIDITDPEKAKEIRQVIKEIIDKAKVIVRIYSAEKEEEIGDKTCNVFEFNKVRGNVFFGTTSGTVLLKYVFLNFKFKNIW